MPSKEKRADPKSQAKPKITLMRVYHSSLKEFWDFWTTKEGLESWWSPEEFLMRVRTLDLRPGGRFEWATTAMDPPQVEALKSRGLPLTSIEHLTYTKIVRRRQIAYKTSVDYIQGVTPYEVATSVEITSVDAGVKLVLIQDIMHDSEYTQTAAIDLDKRFNRLGSVIEARRQAESS